MGIVTFASEDWTVRGQLSARELIVGRQRRSGNCKEEEQPHNRR